MEFEYITDILDKLPEEGQRKVRDVMSKYPDNPWWLAEDPVRAAVGQFENLDCLMIPQDRFEKGLEILMGRPVLYPFELKIESFNKELRSAIDLYHETGQTVEELSPKEAEIKYTEAINAIEEAANKLGLNFIFPEASVTAAIEKINRQGEYEDSSN